MRAEYNSDYFKSKELDQLASDIQDECHKDVEAVIGHNPKINYYDATNAWIFRKIAHLQKQINDLTTKTE